MSSRPTNGAAAGAGTPVSQERAEVRVERWTTVAKSFIGLPLMVIVFLVFVPLMMSTNAIHKLTTLFILMILAVVWNALAGYAGLVSVGQQAFFGLGAYGTVFLVHQHVPPYYAMVLAMVVAGVISVPISFLLLHWRGGQFAVATWVLAEVFAVLVSLDKGLGAGTGISLIELNKYSSQQRANFTYWLTLVVGVVLLGAVFMLLRSRTGASLRSIRDDEDAAASVGVRVVSTKRILYVLAAVGSGAAGACTLANTLFIQPQTTFSVQWSALMIFMVLVGGIGTFEGPILGAILLFVVQDLFADYGAWYLIGLGAVAILFALFLPGGIWGTIERRFGLQLMPVGYRLRGMKISGSATGDTPPGLVRAIRRHVGFRGKGSSRPGASAGPR
jgi:branched-chain amino acid transport system permease protein